MLRPSLTLDFARGRYFDPRLTWARTTTATYVDRQGLIKTAPINGYRIHHDPDNYECLGALIEGAHTNRLLRSAEFDNASWTKTEAPVTADATAAPDGAVAADKVVPSIVNGAHSVHQDITIASAESQAMGLFAKPSGWNFIKLRMGDVADANYLEAVFNLTTGAIVSTAIVGAATLAAARSKFYRRNGFWRCSIAGAVNGGAVTCRSRCFILDDLMAQAYAGDAAKGVYLWGAQHQRVQLALSSYVATVAATVQRTLDAVTLADVSWLNPNEGSIVCQFIARQDSSATQVPFALDDGTLSNRIMAQIASASSALAQVVTVAGAAVVGSNVSPIVAFDQSISMAMRYKTDDFAVLTNAGPVPTLDTAGALPTVTQLSLGGNAGSFLFNSTLARFSYWPKALSNVQLRRLAV